MRIDGCSALVTGAASGLGLATARALAAAGAAVVLLDLPGSAGEQAAAALGGPARFVAGDVTRAEDVQAAVEAATGLGPLRIVVNCAGIAPGQRTVGRDGPLPLEDFERVIRINLVGTFNVIRLAAAAIQATDPISGAGTDARTGTAAGADAGTGTAAGADVGSGADAGSSTAAGADAGTGTAAAAGADAGSGTAAAAGADAGSGTAAGADAGSSTGAGADAGSGTAAGATAGAEAGVGTGFRLGGDSGSAVGLEPGSGTVPSPEPDVPPGIPERGVIINTASVAAFDGQIGQAAYAASKGGVAAMTLPLAREFARSLIRVVAIAPGIFDTPLLQGLPETVRESLAASVPHPARLGDPADFAALVRHIVENPMLNGETIRLDGAIRMPPR